MKYYNEIKSIINDKVFDSKFYDKKMFEDLQKEIANIICKLFISKGSNKYLIIKNIEEYLQNNVSLRMDYFHFYDNKNENIPKEELKYRKAYSALVKKNTTCYGYSEAARILLLIYGIKSKTLLAKLPGEKYRIMHYTTIVEDGDNYIVIDPERRSYTHL